MEHPYKEYGVPEKYVNIIKTLYENSKCVVKVKNSLTDWFFIKTGVRQGCILSPFLFGITIDQVMKRNMENKNTGIKWLNNTTLEDLDFADDSALRSHSYNDQQIKTASLSEIASQVGLLINSTKTKILETLTLTKHNHSKWQ